MTPLRESVLAAVVEVLAAAIPDVPVERARRAQPDIAEFPRIIVRGGNAVPDKSQTPTLTFWTFGVLISGYAKASTDLGAEQALSDLHARVVAALQMAELGPASVQPTMRVAEMGLYSADKSKTPAGEFTTVIEALATAPTAYPYATT